MSALGVVALVVGILVIVALVMAPLRRRASRSGAAIDAELDGSVKRKANAQGLGLESRGKGQVRGNGWLVLTDGELRFRQWVPNRETVIPLDAVTEIDTPRWWLGKSVGSKLLCVRWRTAEGADDAMAWNVPDLGGWLAALSAEREPR